MFENRDPEGRRAAGRAGDRADLLLRLFVNTERQRIFDGTIRRQPVVASAARLAAEEHDVTVCSECPDDCAEVVPVDQRVGVQHGDEVMSPEIDELVDRARDAPGLAHVPRIPQDPHAKTCRDQPGFVARAIVDDEHVIGAEARRQHAG
jgi:hypothetical protein